MQRVKVSLLLEDGVDPRSFEKTLRHLSDVNLVLKCTKGLTVVAAGRKGRKWEADAAEELSLWVSGGKDPHVFTKRGGSGGARRDQRGFSGCCSDLQSDKPIGDALLNLYCIEFKFYEDLTDELWRFFTNQKTPTLSTFWRQVCKAAKPYKKRKPLLVVKINNRRPICFTTDHTLCANSYYGFLDDDPVWCFPFDSFLELKPITQ